MALSKTLSLASGLLATSIFSAQGAIIFQSNFDSDTPGGNPAGWSSPSNMSGANTSVSAVGNGGNSLGIIDTSTNSTSITTTISGNLNATNHLLKLSFDMRVDSYVSGSNGQNPRVILRQGTATDDGLVIGFSRNSIADGDASVDNFLFASPHGNGTSSVSSVGATATQIGLIPNTGWNPGFDFGTYSATETNSTGGWINFSVIYDFNTGLVSGIATNGANSTNFSININPGLTFASGSLLFASPGLSGTAPNTVAATTTSYLDNVVVEVIPEPSALLLTSVALCGLGLRRRRA